MSGSWYDPDDPLHSSDEEEVHNDYLESEPFSDVDFEADERERHESNGPPEPLADSGECEAHGNEACVACNAATCGTVGCPVGEEPEDEHLISTPKCICFPDWINSLPDDTRAEAIMLRLRETARRRTT